VVTAPLRDQAPVLVVKEEETLQLGPRRLLGKSSMGLRLFITQTFHWPETDNSRPTSDRDSSDETPHNLDRRCQTNMIKCLAPTAVPMVLASS
jgi:hypothetical protein